ncbi:MAG TPA: S41 family peptidase [candidate division Zixibacteria bacterium]|nr:S41 family peptidase [candidate division Zixibacteria bacterium]
MKKNATILCLTLLVALCASAITQDHSLDRQSRIYGLSLIWSESKHNYVNYDHLPFDWDSLYLAYLPQVIDATDDFAYYRLLQRFCAQLNDGHSAVYLPQELRAKWLRNFPIWVRLVEGRAIVTSVFSSEVRDAGITGGMEITYIDGTPIHQYAAENVRPYIFASTEENRDFRTYAYELFRGPRDSGITLTVRDDNNHSADHRFERSLKWDLWTERAPWTFEMLEDSIALLTVNTFDNNEFYAFFDSIYNDIYAARALIIDIRNNGGGSSSYGYHLLGHLVDKTFSGTTWHSRQEIPKVNAGDPDASWFMSRRPRFHPQADSIYYKPVALLIGNGTFSAAEDFAATFDYLDRGLLIGGRTGGSSGQPIRFDLPGGGQFKVCTERNSYPDGREFVGIGVLPNIEVKTTVADIRAGRDPQLARALAELSP